MSELHRYPDIVYAPGLGCTLTLSHLVGIHWSPSICMHSDTHPTYLVITYGPDKKTYSQCNIAIFTQFRLQSLHQYIDCVVTIANVGSGALRYSAFLNT